MNWKPEVWVRVLANGPVSTVERGRQGGSIRAVHMQSCRVWDVHLWFSLAVCYEPRPHPHPVPHLFFSSSAAEWVSTYNVDVLWGRRAEARWGQAFWGLRTMWMKRMKSGQRVCQQLFWATEREDLLSNLRPQPFLFPQQRVVQHCLYAKNYCAEIWLQRLSYTSTRTTSMMATSTPRVAGTKLWEDPKLSLPHTSQNWRPVSWSADQALGPHQYYPHVTSQEPTLEGVWGSDFNSYCWKNESFTLLR